MGTSPRTATSLALTLILAAGCGTPGGSGPDDGDPFRTASPSGKPIKVTYIRFNQDPKTRRFTHEYRVMLSDGWKLRNGRSPREAFAKLYKNPFLAESIPDWALEELVREMVKCGLNDLRETPVESISLDELAKVEKSSNPDLVSRWRIINVETETMKKTVTFFDNDDRLSVPFDPGHPDAAKATRAWKFSQVERQVIKVAIQWTVQVTYDTPPMIPK